MSNKEQTNYCMKRKCNECNRYDECFRYKPKQKKKGYKKRKECEKMKTKWTKQKAEEYIRKCKEKGLKYWSARDYLKNHKTMHSII